MFSSLTKSLIRLTPSSTRFFSSSTAKPLKVTFFSTQAHDITSFDAINQKYGFNLTYQSTALEPSTVVLTEGADDIDASVIEFMHKHGVKTLAMRCAGYTNVDLEAAKRVGMEVTRVPAYSPEATAEHTLALILTLNRKIHRAYNRVREGNFALEGLLGFTLHGKTAGIIGTGKFGLATAKILKGFGCRVIACDPNPSEEFKAIGTVVSLEEVLKESDIVSLHCPLVPETRHMINEKTLGMMKKGAMLVNTCRGALINTEAVINALKSHHLGGLAIDVYEQESNLFFKDRSEDIIDDEVFERLLTLPNVLVTGHQGFYTQEAIQAIAETTLKNLDCFAKGVSCENALVSAKK